MELGTTSQEFEVKCDITGCFNKTSGNFFSHDCGKKTGNIWQDVGTFLGVFVATKSGFRFAI